MNFWCHDLHFDDFKSLIARMHGSSSFPSPESSRDMFVMISLLAPFAMKLMLLNVWNALYANFFYPFHT